MKKRTYLGKMLSGTVLSKFLALCVLVIFFAGCKKDPITPPVTSPITPTSLIPQIKKFFPDPEKINSGEKAKLIIEAVADSTKLIDGADTVLIFNNKGEYLTQSLYVNKEYTLIAYGHDANTTNKTSKSATVFVSVVTPPPLTKTQMLTAGAYRLTEIDTIHYVNWGSYPVVLCMASQRRTFHVDGTYEIRQGVEPCFPGQPDIIATGSWIFINNETQLNLDGAIYDFDLTPTSLNWVTTLATGMRYREIYTNQ